MVTSDHSTPLTRRALRERRDPGADAAGFGDATGIFGTATAESPTVPAAENPPTEPEPGPDADPDPEPGADLEPESDGDPEPESELGTDAAAEAELPIRVAADAEAAAAFPDAPAPEPGEAQAPVALAWLDEASVAAPKRSPADLTGVASGYIPVARDLLEDPPHRSPLRPGVLVPSALALLLVGGYSATTLMWPLHEVAPQVEAMTVQPAAATPAQPAWPATGSAAVAVRGVDGVLASTPDAQAIASITKVVTALVVLDRMPLAVGEQGPEFRFSFADSSRYWAYRANGESALDVPAGGSLTQYQLLEGMLIGSANNYADRLAGNLWPTDAIFAEAANEWLTRHGVPGIHVVEPTGLDPGNTATPAALIPLAQKALAHPVIAEIVAKAAVDLPGAGHVENTNGLLADPGVVGVKTGTLDTWNVLAAKDIAVGETTVRVYASVLGQPDDDARQAAARALFAQLETELQPQSAVPAGTTTGHVTTAWGEKVPIVTTSAADIIMWNGSGGSVTTAFDLGDARDEGERVGTLTVAGPLGSATVDLRLADEVDDPSPWWRLTHPLDLFGLND